MNISEFKNRTHAFRAHYEAPYTCLAAEEVSVGQMKITLCTFDENGELLGKPVPDYKLYDTNPYGNKFWGDRMHAFEEKEGAKLQGVFGIGDGVQSAGEVHYLNTTPTRRTYVKGAYRSYSIPGTALSPRDVAELNPA